MNTAEGSSIKRVFISYSEPDEAEAVEVSEALDGRGFGCTLMGPHKFEGDYWKAVSSAIRACEGFVLVVSEHSVGSAEVYREIAFAESTKRVVVPYRLDDSPLPDEWTFGLLSTTTYVKTIDALIDHLRRRRFVEPIAAPGPTGEGSVELALPEPLGRIAWSEAIVGLQVTPTGVDVLACEGTRLRVLDSSGKAIRSLEIGMRPTAAVLSTDGSRAVLADDDELVVVSAAGGLALLSRHAAAGTQRLHSARKEGEFVRVVRSTAVDIETLRMSRRQCKVIGAGAAPLRGAVVCDGSTANVGLDGSLEFDGAFSNSFVGVPGHGWLDLDFAGNDAGSRLVGLFDRSSRATLLLSRQRGGAWAPPTIWEAPKRIQRVFVGRCQQVKGQDPCVAVQGEGTLSWWSWNALESSVDRRADR